jgi:hypothetical protein
MSIGPRAPLPPVAEHATAHCGLMPGDATSQAAGFTHAATHNPRSVSIATAIGKFATLAGSSHAFLGQRRRRRIVPANIISLSACEISVVSRRKLTQSL